MSSQIVRKVATASIQICKTPYTKVEILETMKRS